MDINILTKLITTFRAETKENAISPEVLGALLQRIADILGNAAEKKDFSSVTSWLNAFLKLGSMLNDITIGADDRNNVFFSVTKTNVKTNTASFLTNYLTIRQATTDRAGVMNAQHVIDLGKCKTDITKITKDIETINSSLNTINFRIRDVERNMAKYGNDINTNKTDIDNIKKELTSVRLIIFTLQQNMNTFASMRQTTTIHIEVQIKGGRIFIQGANQLVNSGLTPVIFRYTKRTSRWWKGYNQEKPDVREDMPRRKGWNRFYVNDKIKVEKNDAIVFRVDKRVPTDNKPEYKDSPDALFNYVRAIDMPDGVITAVKLPYGQNLVDITEKHRSFKFAIGFYKKLTEDRTFFFSDLRTNLATFRVQAKATLSPDSKEYNIDYRFARF